MAKTRWTESTLVHVSFQLTDISRNIQIKTIGYYLTYTRRKERVLRASRREEEKERGRRMN